MTAPETPSNGPAAPRRQRQALTAVAAIAVIAGTAAFITIQVRALTADGGLAGLFGPVAGPGDSGLADPGGGAPPRPPGDPLPPAPVRNAIVLGRVGDGRSYVALPRPVEEGEHVYDQLRGYTAREFVRQALLIAARHECGALTRDEVLGEAVPEAADGPAAELVWRVSTRFDAQLRGPRDEGGEAGGLLAEGHTEGFFKPFEIDYTRHVELIEPLSRSTFVEGLREAGLEGEPPPFRPSAEVPEEVQRRLDRVTFTEAFAAVRLAHEAIRRSSDLLNRASTARRSTFIRWSWSSKAA